MRMIIQSLSIWGIMLVLAGCSYGATPPAVSAQATPMQLTTSTQATNDKTEKGSITGVLLDEEGKPISDLGIFVANLTQGPQANSKIISFQINSSKRGLTDAQGNFTINDVPVGSYSLASFTPAQTTLIPAPGDAAGSAILVEVKAGRVTNVGTLKIKRPR